jgi:hypothetical protein
VVHEGSASVTFNNENSFGWFKFDCNAGIKDGSHKLMFALEGAAKEYYELENDIVSV